MAMVSHHSCPDIMKKILMGLLLVLPFALMVVGMHFLKEKRVNLECMKKQVKHEQKIHLETYRSAVDEVWSALLEASANLKKQTAISLEKAGVQLANEVRAMDKKWMKDTRNKVGSEIFRIGEEEARRFIEEMEEKGIAQSRLKNAVYQEWRDMQTRIMTYSEKHVRDIEILKNNIDETLKKDPDVEIRKVLSSSSLAFLTTFEQPWRCYVQRTFPEKSKTILGMQVTLPSGQYAMLLSGRVTVGYDMRKIKIRKPIQSDDVSFEDALPYEVILPKAEIRDVIFDYDRTSMVRMDLREGVLIHLVQKGLDFFYKDLFAQTFENQKTFLEDFGENEIFDEEEARNNIVNVLKPYFSVQGNKVIIIPTETSFQEMIETYVQRKTSKPRGGYDAERIH